MVKTQLLLEKNGNFLPYSVLFNTLTLTFVCCRRLVGQSGMLRYRVRPQQLSSPRPWGA